MNLLKSFVLLVASSVLLAACGPMNDGGDPAPPQPVTVAITALDTLSGQSYTTSAGTRSGLAIVRPSVGDQVNGTRSAGVLTFALDLPEGAVIEQAVLRVTQVETVGDPYADFGSIMLEDVTFDEVGGVEFLDAIIGVLASETGIPGPGNDVKALDVTISVQEDLADGAANSQFRMRAQNYSAFDGEQDVIHFAHSNEDGAPVLEITYREAE